MPSWMSRAMRLRSSRLANWRRRAEQEAGLEGRGDPPGHVARDLSLRVAERLAVRPLRHDDGRRAVAQREGHHERTASPEVVVEGDLGRHPAGRVLAEQVGDVLGDVPRCPGRAPQRDRHEVLGVLGDEHGAAGRRHLGREQVERQGRAGRRVEAGRHLAGQVLEALDQLDRLAGSGVDVLLLLVGELLVPGTEHAEGDGSADPDDQPEAVVGLVVRGIEPRRHQEGSRRRRHR